MSAAEKWAEFPVLALDTETTGVDVYGDRIFQLALVEVTPGKRPISTTYIVDPGVDIPPEATAVHGYTRQRAIAEQTHTPDQMLYEAAGKIAVWLGHGFPLVGMNLAFDLTLFEVECHRHGIDTLTSRLGRGKLSPVVDVLVLDKYADRYRKGGRKLTDLCATYGVRHTGAHDATADCLAAARIWPKLMAKHARKFPGMTLGALHQSQVKWRKDQADSLRAYFDKQGIAHDGVDGGWPLHSGLDRYLANTPACPVEGVAS